MQRTYELLASTIERKELVIRLVHVGRHKHPNWDSEEAKETSKRDAHILASILYDNTRAPFCKDLLGELGKFEGLK